MDEIKNNIDSYDLELDQLIEKYEKLAIQYDSTAKSKEYFNKNSAALDRAQSDEYAKLVIYLHELKTHRCLEKEGKMIYDPDRIKTVAK